MTVLLGFTGALGAGKDEACRQLDDWESSRGLKLVRRGFADQLKVSAARAIGVDESRSVQECVDFCNHLKQDGNYINVRIGDGGWSISGRGYLQLYGTEAHRKVFGTDFWVDALLPLGVVYEGDDGWRQNFGRDCDIAAIPDVRFDNEAKRIKDLNGYIIKIERSSLPQGEAFHASESGIKPEYIDHVIQNDGTLWDLQQNVLAAFDKWAYHLDGGASFGSWTNEF